MYNKEKRLEKIITEFSDAETARVPVGFNIFPAISDTFYRENFHSDILKAFLSTHIGDKYEFGYHFEGDRFLQVFIDMLNATRAENGQSPIDGSLYQKAVVERERHRIDILIRGNGHCIIIENKINDAVDMDRQLPRYYEKMQEDGYTVDAVVYLTTTPEKTPDLCSWDLNDKKAILPLISIIPANDEDGEISLLNNWIKTCCEKALDPDCISSLRQYGALVEHLTPEFKKAKAMRELLGYLYDHPSELKEEIIPVEIIQEIPVEMAREIRENVRKLIRNKGLTLSVGSWSTNSCVINLDNADNQI